MNVAINIPVDDIPQEVYDVLDDLGMQSHLLGYDYMAYAIKLSIENPTESRSLTKYLYPAIAERFGTTPSRVERAIRHCIDRLFDVGDYDIIYKYFKNSIDSRKMKATNGQFIYTMARITKINIVNNQ